MTELELQKLLQHVAEKNGVSVEKVAEDIQAIINNAYESATPL